MDVAERFWSKVDRSGDCWFWQAALYSNGYGGFSVQGHDMKAHRMSWILAYGPIPEGLCVCHNCDIKYPVGDLTYRRCVNPTHLFLGTNEENTADRDAKGRTASGDRSGSRLHPQNLPHGQFHWSKQHPEQVRRGSKHHMAKLNESLVRTIRTQYASGYYSLHELSTIYSVGVSTIYDTVTRKHWQHV